MIGVKLPAGTFCVSAFEAIDWVAGTIAAALTGLVEAEIARLLPQETAGQAGLLARSLVATVHGHCVFALNGTFDLLGVADPEAAALARVRDTLAVAGATQPITG